MHGDNIKNVRNFYMYLNNGAGGYIVYRKAGKESTASWPI